MSRHHESIKGTLPWQVPTPDKLYGNTPCKRCGRTRYTGHHKRALCLDCYSVAKSLGELHVWVDK